MEAGAPPPVATIRKATVDDVALLSQALARAFQDDPVFEWMFPDEVERTRRSERGFAFYLRKVYLPHDECYTTDGVLGGALWMPPETWHLGPIAQLRLLPGMIAALGGRLPRVMRALATIESNHPKEPHWYLPFVGVEPEAQGRGVGTALMRPILERCDGERMPAYLEATTPRNRTCYERQGFEVTEEIHFPKDGPPAWRMWREPRG
ncbi:MAG: GNAT family N-acetyltransferase [Thermoleophilaceae bacterium]